LPPLARTWRKAPAISARHHEITDSAWVLLTAALSPAAAVCNALRV